MHFLAKKLLETRVPLCGLGWDPREKPRKRNGLDLEATCTHQLRIWIPSVYTVHPHTFKSYVYWLLSFELQNFEGFLWTFFFGGGRQGDVILGGLRVVPGSPLFPRQGFGLSQSCVSILLRLQERENGCSRAARAATEAPRPRMTVKQPVILLIVIFMLMSLLEVETEITHTSGGLPSLLQFFFN